MTADSRLTVYGEDGPLGTIEAGDAGLDAEGRVLVRVDRGLTLALPRDFVKERDGGTCYVPLSRDALQRLRDDHRDRPAEDHARDGRGPLVIPVVAEQLEVRKR